MVLIGRRQLRSNNSWMHNVEQLVKGKDRCTAHVHPDDAARLRPDATASRVQIASRTGTITVPAEVTDAVMPRRGQRAPRLGPRPGRRRAARRGRARRRQQQPARRRDAGRPAVGQRRAERHPGRAVAARRGRRAARGLRGRQPPSATPAARRGSTASGVGRRRRPAATTGRSGRACRVRPWGAGTPPSSAGRRC